MVRSVYLLRGGERRESDANIEMRRDSHQNVLGLFDNKRRIRVWFLLGISKLVQLQQSYAVYEKGNLCVIAVSIHLGRVD